MMVVRIKILIFEEMMLFKICFVVKVVLLNNLKGMSMKLVSVVSLNLIRVMKSWIVRMKKVSSIMI